MNEQDKILLDDYFNGLLSAEAERALRERLATDAALEAEFALRRQMEAYPRRAVQRSALAETLATTGAGFFDAAAVQPPEMKAHLTWRRWVAAAAAVALLAAALWFVGTPAPPAYEQYAQHAPLSLTLRGTAEEAAGQAEAAFNAGKYAEALPALERLLADRPDNITAALYRAICLIETGRPKEARAALAPIAGGNSALRAEAQWYVALSYLKENDAAACRAALRRIGPDDGRFKQAEMLLKKLR